MLINAVQGQPPTRAGTCETDYCIAMPHPGDPVHVDTTGSPYRETDLAPVAPRELAVCPWDDCPWSLGLPAGADVDAAVAEHLEDEHDGRGPAEQDPDASWEAMQDEGDYPSWM